MCDQAAGQFEEGFVDVCSAFPSDAESAEAVQPGEGALDHPSVDAKSGAVVGVSSGDGRHDAASPDLIAVDVVVVATVGEQGIRPAAGVPDASTDGWDRVQQRHELGDVVAVTAGEKDGEWGAVAVGDQVVLGACPASVDW